MHRATPVAPGPAMWADWRNALRPPPPATADLLPHIDACNAFIGRALAGGGAVLVHCYAGQSRSAALVMAHLIAAQGLGVMDAWAVTRRARPCAQPNSGEPARLDHQAQPRRSAACLPARRLFCHVTQER
jgi:dual specificity MAP kinase phosphatase